MPPSLLSDLSHLARLDAHAAERARDDETAEYLHDLADRIEDDLKARS
jgi:hypothetical protein